MCKIKNMKRDDMLKIALSGLIWFMTVGFDQALCKETITVLSTNDLHGALLGVEVPEIAGKGRFLGGFDFLSGKIKELKGKSPNRTLVVDAGDCFQGHLAVNILEGEPCVRFFNLAGYSVTTIGNHEFDYGECDREGEKMGKHPRCALEKAVSQAKYPIVVTNIMDDKGSFEPIKGIKRYTILDMGGIKVGVTGVITQTTPHQTDPKGCEGLRFEKPVDAVLEVLPEIKDKGAQVVIVLAHLNGECKERQDMPLKSCELESELGQLAIGLDGKGVDLIVAGHAHSFVAGSKRGVPVIQVGWGGQFIGHAEIELDKGRIKKVNVHQPIPICREESENTGGFSVCSKDYAGFMGISTPDPDVAKMVKDLVNMVDDKCKQVVGIAEEDIPHDKGYETPLGNLTADMMLEASSVADFAMINLGSIRDSLRAGNIDVCDMHRIWPFNDKLVLIELTGEEVMEMFRQYLLGFHKKIAVSGIRIERISKDGIVISTKDGKKIESEADGSGRKYKMVTTRYVINVSPEGSVIKRIGGGVDLSYPTYRDAFIQVIQKWRKVKKPEMGRMKGF